MPQYYRQVFDGQGEAKTAVMADLATFCLAGEETYVQGDPQGSAFNEGRRAVWLHIQGMRGQSRHEVQRYLDRINRNQREDE